MGRLYTKSGEETSSGGRLSTNWYDGITYGIPTDTPKAEAPSSSSFWDKTKDYLGTFGRSLLTGITQPGVATDKAPEGISSREYNKQVISQFDTQGKTDIGTQAASMVGKVAPFFIPGANGAVVGAELGGQLENDVRSGQDVGLNSAKDVGIAALNTIPGIPNGTFLSSLSPLAKVVAELGIASGENVVRGQGTNLIEYGKFNPSQIPLDIATGAAGHVVGAGIGKVVDTVRPGKRVASEPLIEKPRTPEDVQKGFAENGMTHAQQLTMLPHDGQEASIYHDAPEIKVTDASQIDGAVKDLVSAGHVPVATKDLGDGQLGIATKNEAGETVLYRLKHESSLADIQNEGGRPSSQKQIEDLMNTGKNQEAADLIATLPDNDPYKASMESMMESLHPEIKPRALGQDVKVPVDESGISAAPEDAGNSVLAIAGKASTGEPIGDSTTTGRMAKSRLAERQGQDVMYEVNNREATVQRDLDYANKNPDEAVKIVNGTAPEVDGHTQQGLYAALSRKAAETGDTELARELANSHTLTATELGQRVALYGAVEADNPVHVMEGVKSKRVEAAGGQKKVTEKIKSETETIRKAVKDTPLTEGDWKEFTDSIPAGTGLNKLREAIRSGEVDPQKMVSMTSGERNKLLARYTDAVQAKKLNAVFESKTLLKNQKQGFITWAKQAAGLKPDIKRDMLSRIDRLDTVLNPTEEKAFLRDLASQRLGLDVSADEAKGIFTLTEKVNSLKDADPNSIKYGRARVELDNYIQDINNGIKRPISFYKVIEDTAGLAKSMKATLDNSAIFRQGWKTLLTNPGIWAKNALGSFGDLVKTYGGKPVMDELNAKIYADPNYDLMKKAKLAISTGEEEFPTSLPEKIPLLGRVFKASETAYNAFVHKQRVDIFNKYIDIAKKSGVDIEDKGQLEAIGKVVNSLTGRGHLGKLEPAAGVVNNVFFSPRFAKSHIDVLTAHVGDPSITPFARKQAAQNLLRIVSGTAAILAVAKAINPDSVELDPRSSDFGKIKVGDTRFDVSGGMASIATLASRLLTNSTKSSNTGQVSSLNSDAFGSQTSSDVIQNFLTNKLSPASSVLMDLMSGKDRDGNPVTFTGELSNAFLPLPIATYNDLKKDPNSANNLVSLIADGLGISTSTFDQGQSKPGDAGIKAQATQAIVKGDTLEARRIIDEAFTPKEREGIYNEAARSASNYARRAEDPQVDFYSTYENVRKDREEKLTEVKKLVRAGNRAQASRMAQDYNAALPSQFKPYYDKYPSGGWRGANESITGLRINVGNL